MPVVIVSLGTISKQLNDHAQRLELTLVYACLRLLNLQKSVLLGNAHILRRVLQLSGTG